LLVLFPAGGTGAQLGPGLAARLGGAFAASADLEVGEAATPLADGVGRIFVRRWRGDRSSYRRLDPVELERPVVAVLPSGGAFVEHGTADVEVEVITCVAPAKVGVTELSSEADEFAAAALASTLVIVDPSLGGAAFAKLAAAAPAGVVVVDAAAAAPSIAMSVPRVVVAVGGRAPGDSRNAAQPRGRRPGFVGSAPTACAGGRDVEDREGRLDRHGDRRAGGEPSGARGRHDGEAVNIVVCLHAPPPDPDGSGLGRDDTVALAQALTLADPDQNKVTAVLAGTSHESGPLQRALAAGAARAVRLGGEDYAQRRLSHAGTGAGVGHQAHRRRTWC
jgi:hypothetical protein